MVSKAIVYGGTGSLGRATVLQFKKQNWNVTNVGPRDNSEAHQNIVVSKDDPLTEQGEHVLKTAADLLKGEKYDAIICVAGGWSGGNAADKDFFKTCEEHLKKSLYPAYICANLAAHHLKDGGFLLLTGAASADSSAGFIGYGTAKGCVHHLTRVLAKSDSGLPKGARVVCLAPMAIDTEENRKSMPKAVANFTPTNLITQRLYDWANGNLAVNNGTIVAVATKDNVTSWRDLQ